MLPANSDRLVQRMLAQKIVDNLNRIGSASVSSGGFNREQWAKQLEPVMHLWDALTKDRNKELTGDPPKSKPITPVTSFVAMELALAMKLVQKVRPAQMCVQTHPCTHALPHTHTHMHARMRAHAHTHKHTHRHTLLSWTL